VLTQLTWVGTSIENSSYLVFSHIRVRHLRLLEIENHLGMQS